MTSFLRNMKIKEIGFVIFTYLLSLLVFVVFGAVFVGCYIFSYALIPSSVMP